MTVPPGYPRQTVRGQFSYLPGEPMSGTVTLQAMINAPLMRCTTADVQIRPRWTVELDSDGAFSVEVPPTDDPSIQPTGFHYLVIQEFYDERRSFKIDVPSGPDPVDLAVAVLMHPTEAQ